MSKHRKTLIITDDEAAEAEELNPFSFREFLRCKNPEEEEEEEEEEESRRSRGAVGAAADGDGEGTGTGTGTGTPPSPAASCRSPSSLELQLQEENAALRRSVTASERRVSQLTEELLHSRRKEAQEAQDLESMVQSVEHNLRLMTRRAVKAENCVSKLKVDLQQLQAELVCVRSENDRLKAAESQVVMTMRQNAQLAAEHLKKTTSHAHSSIQQLLAEAESLHLVSQLLSSIDKISVINTES
ncbi:LOW QUALITY PROTEIN: endosome-associated-trafficking regulator 1 [Salarias fasciatus]|uniref:LOW QUALITY PROTEIN: endosome-associated-trafficking regulator 1 n=1 Tax=Salarias fasciatus TaxID=181472 RepID=UPI001176B31F|nr:LOW QUALITY PROTEIN: endosome-associated-trafficking regulator 1 [Salarias fasciatus]